MNTDKFLINFIEANAEPTQTLQDLRRMALISSYLGFLTENVHQEIAKPSAPVLAAATLRTAKPVKKITKYATLKRFRMNGQDTYRYTITLTTRNQIEKIVLKAPDRTFVGNLPVELVCGLKSATITSDPFGTPRGKYAAYFREETNQRTNGALATQVDKVLV